MGLSQKLLFIVFLCSSILPLFGIEMMRSYSRYYHHHHRHHHIRRGSFKKLFVFGDSYVDTGNSNMATEEAWKEPYGITFPGKPFGRYSDGQVFTDYLASYLGLKSPIPYKLRKNRANNLKYGMNYAFGGTGVFDTASPYPNMTVQIQLFERLVKDSVFKPSDLKSSIAHLSASGNDYNPHLSSGVSRVGFLKLIPRVVNQIAKNVERISKLGVKKISVAALQPLGCVPAFKGDDTSSSYQKCNDMYNKGVILHNLLLRRAISKLNKQFINNGTPKIAIIDLYNAFYSVLQANSTQQGGPKFKNPLKPCCRGIREKYSCGMLDKRGNKLYTVCQDPNAYFFWDQVHPTQAGWKALMIALQSNLDELH